MRKIVKKKKIKYMRICRQNTYIISIQVAHIEMVLGKDIFRNKS